MKSIRILIALCLLTLPALAAEPIRVLILTGANNHNWKATTPALQKILTDSGRFTVDVTEHPDECTTATFAKYDVVLSNWNMFGKEKGKDWPAATRQAFLDFVRSGKGAVFIHAGSSSFYDWPEYQQIAGATWKINETNHKAPHTFVVKPTAVDHPVTHGLAPFTTTDELWLKPFVQPDAIVLTTAEEQPSALVTSFGKGRGFTLLLGHDAQFMANPGFQALLLRGTEWAATGKVTESATKDPAGGVEAYRYGQSRAVLAVLEKMTPSQLAALLTGEATADCKRAVCERLSLVGTDAEVPTLAKLLGDKELGFYARFALERIPGEKSLAALRAALPDPGAIEALGARRDSQAVPALAKLLPNEAAATALGEIGTREALAALANVPTPALLRCALNLGDVKTLEKLCAADYPRPIRTAAFLGRVKLQGNDVVVAALAGNDVTLQAAALTALQNCTDVALIGKVVTKMSALTPELQAQLLTLLAAHGDAAALPAAMQAAASKDAMVRQAAVQALGTIGNASSVPVLVGFLDGDDRKSAVESLVRLRGDDVNAAMVAALAKANPAPQEELIKALVARNAKSAVPVLLTLAPQSADAVNALGKLADTTTGIRVMALLDTVADENRSRVEGALVAIYRQANDPQPVISAVSSATGAKKASLVTVLGALGGVEVLPAVRAALRDGDIVVQTSAVRVLASWPDAAPSEDLKLVAATTTDPKIKALATRGLERMMTVPSERKSGEKK